MAKEYGENWEGVELMYTKQDLNDAIKHLEEKIDEIENCDCREEHKKLLEMLIDLKKIKR